MGYSARYHATSLIAIFLALAIGVVIGAALGGDTIDNTRKDLEQSLTGNLEDARSHAEELSVELGQANEFSDAVYPVLVRNDLRKMRIGVIAIGGLPGEISGAIDDALGPTGGKLVAVGVVREPVDLRSLAGDLSKTRFADLERNQDSQTEFGTGVGRQLVLGGNLLERVRRPPLLEGKRQLPRARRGDRRPRPAAGHGSGPALDRVQVRNGSARWRHRDQDRRRRGRGL